MIANLVDNDPDIPAMTPITWLVAGALWGRVECLAPIRDDHGSRHRPYTYTTRTTRIRQAFHRPRQPADAL